jgi:hypothetical protein
VEDMGRCPKGGNMLFVVAMLVVVMMIMGMVG